MMMTHPLKCHLLLLTSSTYSKKSILLEKQNAQQHGAVWTTANHLPIVSSVVESLGAQVIIKDKMIVFFLNQQFITRSA